MFQRAIAGVTVVICVGLANGCGGDTGQMDSPKGTGGAAAGGTSGTGATATGSGGVGDSPALPPGSGGVTAPSAKSALIEQYAGTWRYVSGSAVRVCGTDTKTTVLSGTLVLGKGIESDLVEISDACSVAFTVASGNAMVRDGQTCFSADGADSLELRYRAWTFATTDGRTMTQNGSATLTYETSDGRISCDLTLSATLTKVAQ